MGEDGSNDGISEKELPQGTYKDGGTIRILKREFEKEYLVLVLLPMSSCKLLASGRGLIKLKRKWRG